MFILLPNILNRELKYVMRDKIINALKIIRLAKMRGAFHKLNREEKYKNKRNPSTSIKNQTFNTATTKTTKTKTADHTKSVTLSNATLP